MGLCVLFIVSFGSRSVNVKINHFCMYFFLCFCPLPIIILPFNRHLTLCTTLTQEGRQAKFFVCLSAGLFHVHGSWLCFPDDELLHGAVQRV